MPTTKIHVPIWSFFNVLIHCPCFRVLPCTPTLTLHLPHSSGIPTMQVPTLFGHARAQIHVTFIHHFIFLPLICTIYGLGQALAHGFVCVVLCSLRATLSPLSMHPSTWTLSYNDLVIYWPYERLCLHFLYVAGIITKLFHWRQAITRSVV